jgi:hypothetical protein
MLYGMRLSCKHLIQFTLPKTACILLKINLHTWYAFGGYRHLLSKQGTAGKRKHTTSTIPQKLEIIRWLKK